MLANMKQVLIRAKAERDVIATKLLSEGKFSQADYDSVMSGYETAEIETGIIASCSLQFDLTDLDLSLDDYPTEHPTRMKEDSTQEERDQMLRDVAKQCREGTFRSSYAVADNLEQIQEYWKDYIADPNRLFVIQVFTIAREDKNGWRWHKNGPYIGVKEPQCEYLDDEPEIEEILMAHLFELKPDVYQQINSPNLQIISVPVNDPIDFMVELVKE